MALNVKVGSYTGNGSDPQTISGVGFLPKVVIVWATLGAGDQWGACYKTTDMTTGATGRTSAAGENGFFETGLIDSFTSDGFLVRAQRNTNGTVYYYLALGGTDVVTGTYTGNGSDNRSITGIGFKPAWVVTQGGSSHSFHKSTATGDSTDSAQYFSTLANTSNLIQALESDGFQVGNAAGGANVNATVYYYFAVAPVANIASGTYTGNGSDNRNITGIGFNPTAVIVKQSSTAQARSYSGNSGDSSNFSRANSAPAANGIQSLITDGFQVGTDSTVNTNTSTYYWVAFGAAPASAFLPQAVFFE